MLLNKRIPASYILNKVKYDLAIVLIVSLSVLFVTDRYKDLLPEMPLTIPAFIGTAISILLSFKLSQSYDRWWEARKVWGAIVNDSRSFVIQLQTLTVKGNETTIGKIAFRQIAWCYSLGQSLRGLNAMENLDKFISPQDLEEIKQHNNKPLALLHLHGKDIKELKEKKSIRHFFATAIRQYTCATLRCTREIGTDKVNCISSYLSALPSRHNLSICHHTCYFITSRRSI